MASKPTLVLEIEEDAPSGSHSTQSPQWHCRIRCHDLGRTWDDRFISDPFTRDDYQTYSEYLQCKPARQKGRPEIPIKLGEYRKKLFESLKLDELSKEIRHRKLEILICDKPFDNQPKSFHSLQWEQLEHLASWSEYAHVQVSAVTVTRIKGRATQTSVCSGNVFNLLLVVARRNIFDRENDVPSPITIQCTILVILEHLRHTGGMHDVELEIVRPGSFKEFQAHLQRRRTGPYAKVYDAIHFDLHGGISDQKSAYLEFNEYNKSGKLETARIKAKDVAAELEASNVKCAILNACKSATSDSGALANLSWVFLNHGVRNVLAMSYDILDSTAEKFFYHFYLEFVLNRGQFFESAGHARRVLQDEPKRYNYQSGIAVEIQDWFTPVVYSDGTRFQIASPARIDKKMQAKFRPWLRKLKLKVQHALAFFVFWVAAFWFAGSSIIRSGIIPNLLFYAGLSGASERILALLVRFFWYLFPCPLLLHMCQRHSHDQERARFLGAISKHRYDRKNILRIESNLKQGSRMIFFYAKKDATSNARPLLRLILEIWKRTKFVDRQVVVRAEWFIQRWDIDFHRLDYNSLQQSVLIWKQSLLYLLRLSMLSFWSRYHCRGTESKTVVILDNINVLGPSTHDTKPFHVQAQDRLEEWLRHNCAPKPGTAQPYLVLVGNASGGVTTDWFKSRFPRVTTLAHLKMTEFVPESLLLKHKEDWGAPNIIRL